MDWWYEEKQAWAEGYTCVAGIDEAGRGALAGPVVAACVILPREVAPIGINDSKQLSPHRREELYREIMRVARAVGIGVADSGVVDSINILRATYEAMRLSVQNLPSSMIPDVVLIDGNPVKGFPLPQIALVQGDQRCISIAAASIIAKVTRDRMMCEYDALYPAYSFASHKGYGVPVHLHAIRTEGACPIHRKTFRPVVNALRAFPDLHETEPCHASSNTRKTW